MIPLAGLEPGPPIFTSPAVNPPAVAVEQSGPLYLCDPSSAFPAHCVHERIVLRRRIGPRGKPHGHGKHFSSGCRVLRNHDAIAIAHGESSACDARIRPFRISLQHRVMLSSSLIRDVRALVAVEGVVMEQSVRDRLPCNRRSARRRRCGVGHRHFLHESRRRQ